MKICFATTTFPARSQTFVTAQVLRALADGHEVSVACRKGEADPGLSPAVLATLDAVRVFCWPPEPTAYLRNLPVRLRSWIVQRATDRAWRRQNDADVVIAHFGYTGATVERAQRGWHGRPPLVTVYHGRDVTVEHRRDGLARYRNVLANGDLHLAVNAPFAGLLAAAGAPGDRVDTYHLGVPVEDYAYAPTAPDGCLRLAAVARLVPKKGLDVAIAALTRLHERHPELGWRFDIAGEGPMEADLRRQVSEAGLNERVRFLGPLSHAAALDLIAGAHALLLPSVTAEDGDQEGIPVTLMEAMALGTPVCTTRHSGIPELVEHGRTGLLSDERDVAGLCANILAVAEGSVDVPALAMAARETIERDFDQRRQIGILFERCARLADAAQARRR